MMRHRSRWSSTSAMFSAWALAVLFVVVPSVQAQTETHSTLSYLEQVRHETGAPGVTAAVLADGVLVFSDGVGLINNCFFNTSSTLISPDSTTSKPIERAVPSIILDACSMLCAFKSSIFFSAISAIFDLGI